MKKHFPTPYQMVFLAFLVIVLIGLAFLVEFAHIPKPAAYATFGVVIGAFLLMLLALVPALLLPDWFLNQLSGRDRVFTGIVRNEPYREEEKTILPETSSNPEAVVFLTKNVLNHYPKNQDEFLFKADFDTLYCENLPKAIPFKTLDTLNQLNLLFTDLKVVIIKGNNPFLLSSAFWDLLKTRLLSHQPISVLKIKGQLSRENFTYFLEHLRQNIFLISVTVERLTEEQQEQIETVLLRNQQWNFVEQLNRLLDPKNLEASEAKEEEIERLIENMKAAAYLVASPQEDLFFTALELSKIFLQIQLLNTGGYEVLFFERCRDILVRKPIFQRHTLFIFQKILEMQVHWCLRSNNALPLPEELRSLKDLASKRESRRSAYYEAVKNFYESHREGSKEANRIHPFVEAERLIKLMINSWKEKPLLDLNNLVSELALCLERELTHPHMKPRNTEQQFRTCRLVMITLWLSLPRNKHLEQKLKEELTEIAFSTEGSTRNSAWKMSHWERLVHALDDLPKKQQSLDIDLQPEWKEFLIKFLQTRKKEVETGEGDKKRLEILHEQFNDLTKTINDLFTGFESQPTSLLQQ